MKSNPGKIAVITGANRGLGFESARQLSKLGVKVILTARDSKLGRAAADKLSVEGGSVVFHPLDVTQDASVAELFQFVRKEFGHLDILINNAGILPDDTDSIESVEKTFQTNVSGVYRMLKTFLPLLKQGGYGRVVNVSSRMGQLSEMNGGYAAYRISKTAVNAVTRIFAAETEGSNIKVNSVCPGWVKTDMGGPGAELTPTQGVDTIVWAATLPDDGPSGVFLAEREIISW